LGFTEQNAQELRVALLRAAAEKTAEQMSSDQFGVRYVIDFQVAGPLGTGTV